MSEPISDPKDLKEAIENNQDTIEIKGNLADRTVKIKATGKVAWTIALGAVIVALTAILIAPAAVPVAAPIAVPAEAVTLAVMAPTAVATIGMGATISMISLSIAAGSVAAAKLLFKKLRTDYVITEKRKGYVVLKRK